MTKKLSFIVAFAILIHTGVFASNELSKNRESKQSIKKSISPSKAVEKNWQPSMFDENTETLPVNYTGVDRLTFLKNFKNSVSKIKKDEYETQSEFESRIADIEKILAPISTQSAYAFLVSEVDFRYDADKQHYLVNEKSHPMCQKTLPIGEFQDRITCKIFPVHRETSTYVGSNAYGTKKIINRVRGTDLSLGLKRGSAFPGPNFKQNNYKWDNFSFQDTISIPLEKARSLKNMNLAMLFIGKVTDAKIISGRGTSTEPTIDNPTDTYVSEEAIPFNLDGIVYFVPQTGEIIAKKFFK